MLTIRDITRSGHVTRWHCVRTSRDQNIAEHQYMVAMLAQEMAERILERPVTDTEYRQLVEYSLRHDSPEIVLGDMPGPVKRKLEQLYGDSNPLDEIEASVCPRFKAAKDALTGSPLKDIVKLADLADAIAFITEEGNTKQSAEIAERTRKHFDEYLHTSAEREPSLYWQGAATVLDEVLNGATTQISW